MRPARAAISGSGARARQVSTVLWWLATALLFLVTARSVERSITWYLAVDQYGYLAFAHDLSRGRVFHDWPPMDAFAPSLTGRTDVLMQTYVYDHGRLYCRYAPGFPLMLAAWLVLFGDDGAHYLNPVVFLALLALVLAFQARLFRSRWRATAGIALVVLCPTLLNLWALTLVRDLPAHLFGLGGLFLLLPVRGRRLTPRRVAAAGVALGFAGSIRPDAVIYLLPAVLVVLARWWHERGGARLLAGQLAAGSLAVVTGLAPFFAYNWIATGSPLRPTQGMEIEQFLPAARAPQPDPAGAQVGYPPGAWRGGTFEPVQGGGLRLSNLPRTLPGNVRLVRSAYGDLLLVLAAWGAVLALLRRRLLFLVAVPYIAAALVFFSFWARPDSRYLCGIFLLTPMLVVEGAFGTLDLVRRLGLRGRADVARLTAMTVAGLVILAAALLPMPTAGWALPRIAVILPGLVALSALAAAAWPQRRTAALAAPALALALVGLAAWRAAISTDRARFQRPEMVRARTAFAAVVAPKAVVITTEEVGRPAENIDYYSGAAHALYLTDLERWRMPVPHAAAALARAGWTPYLFIPFTQPDRAAMLGDLQKTFEPELVIDVPPARAIEYFVAASFLPRGVRMELYRLHPRPAAAPSG
jgi:hypothetical protein